MLSFVRPSGLRTWVVPALRLTARDLADRERVDMQNDNPTPCQASESCTDRECHYHRFDLYSAMVGVADAWLMTLGMHEPETARKAFLAVADLAASEVMS